MEKHKGGDVDNVKWPESNNYDDDESNDDLSLENSSVDGNAKDAYPNDVDQDEDNLAQGLNEKLNA